MHLKKVLNIILGCIGLGIGAVGAVVPMLPAFPFLLLAAFCFARSSEKAAGSFAFAINLILFGIGKRH